jgi:hypothetical protein
VRIPSVAGANWELPLRVESGPSIRDPKGCQVSDSNHSSGPHMSSVRLCAVELFLRSKLVAPDPMALQEGARLRRGLMIGVGAHDIKKMQTELGFVHCASFLASTVAAQVKSRA